jgi:hypothetical protein
MTGTSSPGLRQADGLRGALRDLRSGSAAPRTRQVLWGLDSRGVCQGTTVDRILAQARDILAGTGRAYRYENSIVLEAAGGGSLANLAVDGQVDPRARSILSNIVVAARDPDGGASESLVPTSFVAAMLADEALADRLPAIRYYARRPTFDLNFALCRPGWNVDSGILVHADEVDLGPDPAPAPGGAAVDRLPPHLRELLREFPWASDADLANAVAVLLTGLLINHFIEEPHPVVIVDGNQPEVGKSLLVSAIGLVFDGVAPPPIPLGQDDEVEKRLCAELLTMRSSVFFFDNVRQRIESVLLEQSIPAPLLSFRILGRSATASRPNTFLWMITSNQTAGTSDLIGRCVPIRLHVEGA